MKSKVRKELIKFLDHAAEDFGSIRRSVGTMLGICSYASNYYKREMDWASKDKEVRKEVRDFIMTKLTARAEEVNITDNAHRRYLFGAEDGCSNFVPQYKLSSANPLYYERSQWLKKLKAEVERRN